MLRRQSPWNIGVVQSRPTFWLYRGQDRSISRMRPAEGQFTSQNEETAQLFRKHGYDPQGCLVHRVPWGDQDSYGHVNNVKYVRYFETARVNYFDILASQFDKFPGDFMLPRGIGPVLRKTDVDFLSQLVRNDVIAIQHRLSGIGSSSFLMEAMIVHEGRQEIVCRAKEVLVMYDFINRRKAPIPEGWRKIFDNRQTEEKALTHSGL